MGVLYITIVMLLQSCMSEIKPKSVVGTTAGNVSTTGYSGCVVATGLTTSTIQVSYDFPAKATEVSVYRNGINVLTSRNRLSTTFIDINLAEGQTYNYECVATIDGVTTLGVRDVDGATLAVNPPTFTGIDSVVAISPSSVRVNWPATNGGAVAKEFRVFVTMNGALNFSSPPKLTLQNGVYTAVLSGLADDMPYEFGVRACNANGLCDTNTKSLSLTTEDKGPATTPGATAVSLYNGIARITAPWIEENGAVFKRRLYRGTTSDVTTILTTLVKTINVTLAADLAHPPTVIEDETILEGQTYYYIVRDEDPSGNITASTNVVTLVIGDLTAPIFSGLSSIALDTPAETSVLLGWTAIGNQPTDSNGATFYLLYKTEATLPATPANACSAGTLFRTLNASTYTPGMPSTFKVTGLTSRKKYSFCLKAQDAALNISATTSFREQLMPDLTAPQFDGIQNVSYNVATNKFTMVWNPSSSSDINQYMAKVWKNTPTPTAGQITSITYNVGTNPISAIFGTTEFNFTDGDTVYMLVDACDNASPSYNTSNNCTSFALSSAISKNLIDTSPPPGFLGVASTIATAQGVIQVNWTLPADKSDYAGFKFYNIEETSPGVFTKVFLADTYCTANSCATTPKTTFNLPVSRDYHTYNIFMSAVDLYGNETKATDAIGTLTYNQVTTVDTTKPNFTSSLASTLTGGFINLSWNAATDNQYAKKNVNSINKVTYEVYRKEGTTNFDTSTYVGGLPNVAGDPTIIKVVSGLVSPGYSDPTLSLTQGQTYNYTVCARDESNNVQCDGFRTVILADNLPPIIATVRIDEAPNTSVWYLNLKVSDGVKAPGTVITYVYAKFSDDPNDFPDGSGAQVSAAMIGTGTVATPTEFIFYSDSLSNSSLYHYVNYYVKAVDAASNVATTTYSHIIRRPTIAAATGTATITEDTLTAVTLTTAGSPGTGLSASNLSYELVTPPAHGTLSACMNLAGTTGGQDLVCNYLGNANYFGTDTFTYRVKDNLPMVSANVVTVNLTITNVNDNPVATSSSKSIMVTGGPVPGETTTIDVVSTATDPDNAVVAGTNTLTVVTANPALSRPNIGSVSCSGQNCTIAHSNYSNNKYGTASFNYQITDGAGGLSNIGTYTVKIYSQYTWTGAIDSDWTKGGNWCGSLNASGACVGAVSAPPTNAHVVFSDLCINCNVTIPASMSYGTITLSETFTGTVTVGNGVSLSLAGGFFGYKGTFDATLGGNLSLTNTDGPALFLDTGVFKAPATMSINTGGARYGFISVAAASTFTHNNGTVTLTNNYIDPAYVSFANKSFYNLTILNSTVTNSVSSASSYTVQNNLIVQKGVFTQQLSTYKVKVGGNLIQRYVSASNYGEISTLNTVLTGPNSYINMQNTSMSAGNIEVDVSGQAYSTNTSLIVSSLTIKDGTFNAPTGNMYIQRYINVDNSNGAIPIFYHNNGTTIYGSNPMSSGDESSTFTTPIAFNHLKILRDYEQSVKMTGTFVVKGNMRIEGQTANAGRLYTVGSGEVQLEGNLDVVFTHQYNSIESASIRLVGSNNQIITANDPNGLSHLEDLYISKTGGNVTFAGILRVTRNLDLDYSLGTVNMGTSKIMLGGIPGAVGTIRAGATEFNDLEFSEHWTSNTTIDGDLITNNLILKQNHYDSIKVSGGRILVKKDFTINYLSYTGATYFSTDIYLVGTGTQNITWAVSGNPQNQMIKSNIYINKPSGTAVFLSNFNLNYYTKNIILNSGTVNFNGYNVQVNSITTNPGTIANSWSTLTKTFWTNNGGTQSP